MNLAAIIIGLAITVAVAAYVAEPLVRGRRSEIRDQRSKIRDPHGASEIETSYRTTLEAIRELDFDFQTGKIVEEDYRTLRERYVSQGAALLQRLDQLDSSAPEAARQRRAPAPSGETVSDQIEALVMARRKPGSQARPAQTCPACGQPCRAEDRFCGKCGARLEAEA
ncbi:MAG: zinc ribbon domain-containing protein [Thermoflexales bacterium]|nr:zinc ribbon domain-containing protein [Thermoflexales bacterium]